MVFEIILKSQLSILNYFATFAEYIGSVVQWIEFKIPVLTIAVRIRSESRKNEKRNRRTKQEQRVLAHYALQEGGKACGAGLKVKTENYG